MAAGLEGAGAGLIAMGRGGGGSGSLDCLTGAGVEALAGVGRIRHRTQTIPRSRTAARPTHRPDFRSWGGGRRQIRRGGQRHRRSWLCPRMEMERGWLPGRRGGKVPKGAARIDSRASAGLQQGLLHGGDAGPAGFAVPFPGRA